MTTRTSLDTLLLRWSGRTLVALLGLSAIAYAADFARWRALVAHGDGWSSVEVTRFKVASLKGGREEYYPEGTDSVRCSRSAFPQAGERPCWWLRNHRVLYDR